MGYRLSELRLLDKEILIEIILNQESQLLSSHRGQPRRDNLVGESFGALVVVGDAGNQQGHSTWHCRCSGNIYDSSMTGVCDRKVVVWGSNLKGRRQQYCGDPFCYASRQVLGQKRRKDLRVDEKFQPWMKQELIFKYALLGDNAPKLVTRDYDNLCTVFADYYGLREHRGALKIAEIAQQMGLKETEVSALKKSLDGYLDRYREINENNSAKTSRSDIS